MKMRSLALSCLLLAPASAHAQTIHGVLVEDDSGEAITGAHVELVGPDGGSVAEARTDRAGAFLLRLHRAGSFTVRLTHLAYAALESDTVVVGRHESLSLELRMARAAIPLEPLVVTARAVSRGIGGFHERMRRPDAAGHFLSRAEIRGQPAARTTDLLRMIPGVHLMPVRSGGTAGYIIAMDGVGNPCRPTIYVDGLVMRQFESLDSYLSPAVLEGIEVYRRGISAPPPIVAHDRCGVVAFWTRREQYEESLTLRKLGAWLGVVATLALISRL